jgi:hypothetical protein
MNARKAPNKKGFRVGMVDRDSTTTYCQKKLEQMMEVTMSDELSLFKSPSGP